jgi:hypothetical protein
MRLLPSGVLSPDGASRTAAMADSSHRLSCRPGTSAEVDPSTKYSGSVAYSTARI